jgi:hypothetical protein
VSGVETGPSDRERTLRERLVAAPGREPVVPVVAAAAGLFLWAVSTGVVDLYLDPQRGLGYALGVIGVVAMVLLLVYPARKRLRVFGWLPPLRQLFRLHMTLGVLAPVAILLHCDFALGSPNSTVALACLLLVAGSGFFGRFIYSRIHRGLFGSRRHLDELRREVAVEGGAVHAAIHHAPELESHLQEFEALALESRLAVRDRALRFVTIGWRGAAVRREARRKLHAVGTSEGRAAYEGFAHYLHSLGRVARFLDYERLFSLWHAVHVPLCFLLFACTAVHVLAVHLY